jgi:hypothetical protein
VKSRNKIISKNECGIDVMVACDLAKVIVGVRFSYPAPRLLRSDHSVMVSTPCCDPGSTDSNSVGHP